MKEGDAPCVRNSGAECETETGDQGDRVAQSGDRAQVAVRAAEVASAETAASAGTVASAAQTAQTAQTAGNAGNAGNAATEAATGDGTMGRSRPSARWGRRADQAR
jgi:hypothetical protein